MVEPRVGEVKEVLSLCNMQRTLKMKLSSFKIIDPLLRSHTVESMDSKQNPDVCALRS